MNVGRAADVGERGSRGTGAGVCLRTAGADQMERVLLAEAPLEGGRERAAPGEGPPTEGSD